MEPTTYDIDADLTVDDFPEEVIKEMALQLDHPYYSKYRYLAAQYGFMSVEIDNFHTYADTYINKSPTRYLFAQLRARRQHELSLFLTNLELIQCLSVVRIVRENLPEIRRKRPSRTDLLRVLIASAPCTQFDQVCLIALKEYLQRNNPFSVVLSWQFGASTCGGEEKCPKILKQDYLDKADVVIFVLSDGLQTYLTVPDSKEDAIRHIQRQIQFVHKYVFDRRHSDRFSLLVARFGKIDPQTVPDWLLRVHATRQFSVESQSDKNELLRYLHEVHAESRKSVEV